MDFMMPGMNGIEVVKALRAASGTARLPVLMLTTLADEACTRAGFEAGVTDYMTKPFSIPQLAARVRACLARSAAG
jgi:two-component system phosphate regulon response regulator PhoB